MKFAWMAIAAILLAGCTEAPPAEPDAGPGPAPAIDAGPEHLDFTVDAPDPVRNQTWRATGTLGSEALLRFSEGDDLLLELLAPAGAWEATVALPFYGAQAVTIEAEADDLFAGAEIHVNALAPATVAVNYGPGGPPAAVDGLWVDLENLAASPDYEEEGASRADYANIHDVMVTWEGATDHVVEYSYNSGFNSFGVDRIDGYGNALNAGAGPYWCYDVNGEAAGAGISIERFTPGDRIDWAYCGT